MTLGTRNSYVVVLSPFGSSSENLSSPSLNSPALECDILTTRYLDNEDDRSYTSALTKSTVIRYGRNDQTRIVWISQRDMAWFAI